MADGGASKKRGRDGRDGLPGRDGKSAYDMALSQGFKGSEALWVELLIGKNELVERAGIYQAAKAHGYAGSYQDLVALLKGDVGPRGPEGPRGPKGEQGPRGEKGDRGDRGLSAYEIALEQGFDGTEAQWVKSLKGERGERGPRGERGERGERGPAGPSSSGGNLGGGPVNLRATDVRMNDGRTVEQAVNEAGGGSGSVSDWGDIGGLLADQTDLQGALDLKLDAADFDPADFDPAGAASAAQAAAISAAATDATTKANAAQAAATSAAATDATTKANAAQAAAEATAAADATTKANAAKAYADTLVVGLIDDRGNFDASGNVFPSSGGSGAAGAVLKGDLWTVSVAGTLGGTAVTAGDLVRAVVDAPGQTAGNWAVTENNIGYVAEPQQTAASQAEAEAGSGTSIRSWTPQRVWQAIAAALALGTWISGASGKTTPVDADSMPLSDSAASNATKKVTWANVKATLKTYFDSLYPTGSGTSTGTNTGDQTSIVGITGTKAQFDTAVTDGNFAYQSDLSGYQTVLSLSANTFYARGSSGAAANKTISDDGLTFLAAANQAAMRAAIGAGTGSGSGDAVLAAATQTFTGQNTFAQGTIVTSKPQTITQTWNDAAVAFTAWLINITNTASAAASYFADFQIAGVSLASIRKDGLITSVKNGAHAIIIQVSGQNPVGFGRNSSVGGFQVFGGSASTPADNNADMLVQANLVRLPSGAVVGWSPSNITQNSDASYTRAGPNAIVYGTGTVVAGAVTSRTEVNKAVASIADATATLVLTVTVPNAAHSASIMVTLTGSLGAGGAIGANEATGTISYIITIARTAGVNAVAAISSAFGSSVISVAGGATITVSGDLSAISGAAGAANTFNVRVTITKGGGSSANHTCLAYARLMNANANGITLA